MYNTNKMYVRFENEINFSYFAVRDIYKKLLNVYDRNLY